MTGHYHDYLYPSSVTPVIEKPLTKKALEKLIKDKLLKLKKEPHEYWYYFSCIDHPVKISKGTLPMWPYRKFETKKECNEYIKSKKRG